jgi:mycofactocin precursor
MSLLQFDYICQANSERKRGDMTSAQPDQSAVPAPLQADTEALERPADRDRTEDELVETELLVEDVSIDGMCGVY